MDMYQIQRGSTGQIRVNLVIIINKNNTWGKNDGNTKSPPGNHQTSRWHRQEFLVYPKTAGKIIEKEQDIGLTLHYILWQNASRLQRKKVVISQQGNPADIHMTR